MAVLVSCRAGNKGWAYTFLTPEQGRYAGDITRALELSGADVPPELTELWDTYKSQQELEGKKVKTGGGFSGKGFKFDESEAQQATEMRKFQKHALGKSNDDSYFNQIYNIRQSLFLGLQDSDDEDIEGEIDQQIDMLIASKKSVKEVIAGAPTPSSIATPGAAGSSVPSTDKLELAKRVALKLTSSKNLGADSKAQMTAEAVMKGGIMNLTPKVTGWLSLSNLSAQFLYRILFQNFSKS